MEKKRLLNDLLKKINEYLRLLVQYQDCHEEYFTDEMKIQMCKIVNHLTKLCGWLSEILNDEKITLDRIVEIRSQYFNEYCT